MVPTTRAVPPKLRVIHRFMGGGNLSHAPIEQPWSKRMAFGLTRDGVLNSISRRWPQELRRQYDLYQKDRPVPAQRTACSIDVANLRIYLAFLRSNQRQVRIGYRPVEGRFGPYIARYIGWG